MKGTAWSRGRLLHSCDPCCHVGKNVSREKVGAVGAFGHTPLSPHGHVVLRVPASLVERAARGRSGGGTARMSQDSNTNRTNATEGGGRLC